MNKEVLNKAIETYGINAQLDMCFEEMAELMKEISKKKRGKDNHAELVEELADVYIMLKQLEIMCDVNPKELHGNIYQKIDRLKGRLENGRKN